MSAEPAPRPGSLVSRLRLVEAGDLAEPTAGVTSRTASKSAAKSAARKRTEQDREDALSWLAPPDENGVRHLTKEQVEGILGPIREARRARKEAAAARADERTW